ncbi:sulfite exporter TauE/SafE family protein [Luteimonas dalianensis]|uniref:sulfite exporter TauE/SafE family protein n=1 Tax=Luteimonas dalianensis TaxID=1148196 RepID=UPI003BF16D9E
MLTLLLTFLALGALVGVLAGLLGIGGGLVLVAALAWLLPQYGIPKEAAMHAALASSLGSIVLTSLSSSRAHHRRGSVLWPSVAWLAPGVVVGAWLGSRFAIALDGAVLRWAFVGYCLLIAAQMAFSRSAAPGDAVPAPRGLPMALAGGGIGAVSAVVGIGGGSLTVPLLTWLGVAPVRAVGTAAACGIFIGLASAAGYALQAPAGALGEHAIGYVYLPAALGVATASILTAPLGARIAHAISGVALKRVFAVFMLLVGLGMAAW